MDVETELSKESDVKDTTKLEEMKKRVEVEPSEKSKESRKIKLKRSTRSRTPQKKVDDPKVLQVALTKVEEEVNGKEEKTEKKDKEKNGEENCENQKVESVKEDNQEPNTNGSVEEPSLKDTNKESENGLVLEGTENCTTEKHETAKDNGLTEKQETEEAEETETAKDSELKEKQEPPKKLSKQESKVSEPDSVEMEPLVISDEVESELQFLEETSDKDSGKGSPIIPRCFTRRSYTRNIPTPKTPKLPEDPDSEKKSVLDQTEETICNLPNDTPIPKTDLNESSDSLDTANTSTKVEVGGDVTRLNFAEVNSSADEQPFDESYLNRLRERSLSGRRPLRATDDYRKRVLRNAQNKSDLNLAYDSVEKVSTSFKRKNRSRSPEDGKRFKVESPGYKNFFISPLASLRNTFTADLPSSTPELLGYKDERGNLHYNDRLNMQQIEDTGDDEKKNWCSVM